MGEVIKIKKGLLVECDCGATHKILTDETGEIIIKSKYEGKKNEQRKTEEKSEPDPTPKAGIDSFFE